MADIKHKYVNGQNVLIVFAQTDDEAELLTDFCRPREELKAKMYCDPSFTYPSLEIRKEVTS